MAGQNDIRFEKFMEGYKTLSPEKRGAVCWLLKNISWADKFCGRKSMELS